MSNRKPAERLQTQVAPPEDRGALQRVLALAPAPLYPNESEADFEAFAERVVLCAKPTDTIEEILVRDVIELAWEVIRLRRIKAGLLKVNMHRGVSSILETIACERRYRVVEAWAAGDEEARAFVQDLLAQAGLSLVDVTAKTIELTLDSFERLDRMLASSEARRNNALRETERHREALGAASRRALDDAVDVEFRDVESGELARPDGLVGEA